MQSEPGDILDCNDPNMIKISTTNHVTYMRKTQYMTAKMPFSHLSNSEIVSKKNDYEDVCLDRNV